jgi:hypothetical protein
VVKVSKIRPMKPTDFERDYTNMLYLEEGMGV